MSDLPEQDLPNDQPPEVDTAKGVLGKQVPIPTDPETFEIDVVPNPTPDRLYVARFSVPEFTSLCPKTGQPDHATIVIDYVPHQSLIESKSLKLFMFSFRNHGAYHEAVTNMIAQRLFNAALPVWMQVSAYFNPRGGIPIDVFSRYGALPEGFKLDTIPNHDIPIYSGR